MKVVHLNDQMQLIQCENLWHLVHDNHDGSSIR